ncbi:MAG TPA: phosphoribosylformylglycinamidine cyclo-ligase, partial [Planctomycetota bacterium]|nr:phosphoribosylformylglycinamidine cyclo-ligase [Planctomycetota bacterium]
MDYRAAGVDIAAADDAKDRIKRLLAVRRSASVLSEIGSFGGVFQPDFSGLEAPVLVSSTDGVGTKIRIARDCGVHDTVGYDLVAHCVNDILVQGAFPLFFLDYFATGRLEPAVVEAVLSGMGRACREFGCAIIGGELAEMGDLYRPGDYDIAGFIVGAVERDRLLTGSTIAPGDLLIGLPSVGLHTNGYSLARKIFFERLALRHDSQVPELGGTVARVLLAPHRGYLAALRDLVTRGLLSGMAHITGGGLTDNVPRILPEGCTAVFHRKTIEVLPVFRFLQREGNVPEADMWRTFNMGIGMVLAVAPENAAAVETHLTGLGEKHTRI